MPLGAKKGKRKPPVPEEGTGGRPAHSQTGQKENLLARLGNGRARNFENVEKLINRANQARGIISIKRHMLIIKGTKLINVEIFGVKRKHGIRTKENSSEPALKLRVPPAFFKRSNIKLRLLKNLLGLSKETTHENYLFYL